MSELRRAAATALLLMVSGCETPQYEANFPRIQAGMTQADVEALLGKPSSTFVERREDGQAVVPQTRWQYGDNLSTLATGAVYPGGAPARVWVVYFNVAGKVDSTRAPDWARQGMEVDTDAGPDAGTWRLHGVEGMVEGP